MCKQQPRVTPGSFPNTCTVLAEFKHTNELLCKTIEPASSNKDVGHLFILTARDNSLMLCYAVADTRRVAHEVRNPKCRSRGWLSFPPHPFIPYPFPSLPLHHLFPIPLVLGSSPTSDMPLPAALYLVSLLKAGPGNNSTRKFCDPIMPRVSFSAVLSAFDEMNVLSKWQWTSELDLYLMIHEDIM
jgi:hypothetical protein